MPFPRGQGLLTHRGNTTVHISQPGSLGSLRLLGTPLQHDCELQVSKRCTEQLFKLYQSEVFLSRFPLKCLSKLILLLHLFSFEMPIYSMTASTRTVPLQMPTESWVWGWRQEPRDDLHFEQGFSDPTFSCWEKERNPLPPAMAECNNPSTAGEQRQNPKLPKEELGSCLRMQLWSHRGHLPPVQTPSPSLSANMTLWHQVCCCEAAKQLIPDSLQLWMCLGLVLPSCATIAFGFRHSPLPPIRPNQLWGVLWAQSWPWLPVHSENREQLWGSTNSPSPQEMRTCRMEEETATGWLWISLHSVCTCSCAVCSA